MTTISFMFGIFQTLGDQRSSQPQNLIQSSQFSHHTPTLGTYVHFNPALLPFRLRIHTSVKVLTEWHSNWFSIARFSLPCRLERSKHLIFLASGNLRTPCQTYGNSTSMIWLRVAFLSLPIWTRKVSTASRNSLIQGNRPFFFLQSPTSRSSDTSTRSKFGLCCLHRWAAFNTLIPSKLYSGGVILSDLVRFPPFW